MSGIRRLALGAAFAVGTAFVIAPHAALALGSTPVTVTNPVTVGNPDDPVAFAKAQNALRHPFLLVVGCSFEANHCSSTFDFSASNPNQTIVTTHISGVCFLPTGEQLVDVAIAQNTIKNDVAYVPTPDHVGVVSNEGGLVHVAFEEATSLPLPANTVILLSAEIDQNVGGLGNNCALTLAGEATDQ